MLFSAKQKILFQGDSITDRLRRESPHEPYGAGYVNMVTSMLDARYAEMELTYFNRGIGGNAITDMQKRWKEDCLDLNCDWVSILIGVNDAHRSFSGEELSSPENYYNDYRSLLQDVVEKTSAKLILWEPFYFVTPQSIHPKVADIIDQYIRLVNDLANEFSDRVVGVIHTQKMFAEAAKNRGIEFWIPEGVHPTKAGHALMACEFLKFVEWKLD